MQRRIVIQLGCLGLLALSCEITGAAPPSTHLVGATEGAHVAARAQDATAPRGDENVAKGELAAELEDERLREIILTDMRRRHTALSEAELVALSETIVEEARRHDLDPALVMAVIAVESSGYHLAVSPVGALGLMQLMPATGEELAHKLDLPWRGPDSLFDPILNVKLGTAYLRQLESRYESTDVALAAYNWGPGRIDRRLRRGAPVPSLYIEQVMKAYNAGPPVEAGRS